MHSHWSTDGKIISWFLFTFHNYPANHLCSSGNRIIGLIKTCCRVSLCTWRNEHPPLNRQYKSYLPGSPHKSLSKQWEKSRWKKPFGDDLFGLLNWFDTLDDIFYHPTKEPNMVLIYHFTTSKVETKVPQAYKIKRKNNQYKHSMPNRRENIPEEQQQQATESHLK